MKSSHMHALTDEDEVLCLRLVHDHDHVGGAHFWRARVVDDRAKKEWWFRDMESALRKITSRARAITADTHTKSLRSLFAHPLRTFAYLSTDEASFSRRGFCVANNATQEHLEEIGSHFIRGYNTALRTADISVIRELTSYTPPRLRGFIVEGGAMAFAVMDALSIGPNKLSNYLAEFDKDFIYLAHVGAGWAAARLPCRQARIFDQLHKPYRWLGYDGIGFHDTYFRTRKVTRNWKRFDTGYESHAYDQGIGRALWFVSGGSGDRAADAITSFPESRTRDLWSGLGLAIAYAGPISLSDSTELKKRSGPNWPALAQGVAFGCEAHARGGYIPEHTETAAKALACSDALSLVHLVRQTRDVILRTDNNETAYDAWQSSVAQAIPPRA